MTIWRLVSYFQDAVRHERCDLWPAGTWQLHCDNATSFLGSDSGILGHTQYTCNSLDSISKWLQDENATERFPIS